MKRSIKAIAAAAAALTMAISCVPTVYAVRNAPAGQSEAETKAGFEFTVGKTVDVPYNGNICMTADDGTVYYEGADTANGCVYFFSLDKNGKMDKSYKFSKYVNDKGQKVGMMNSKLKQCGEYFYLIYSEAYGLSMGETFIIKLDGDLNEVKRYRAPKTYNIDTNGEKIVYIKGSKIYSTDMNGKNKQELYTAGSQLDSLNFLVVSGDYAGFQLKSGAYAPKDCKDYCGIIDLKTGKVTLKKQRSVQQMYGSNGRIIWYSSESRDIRDSYKITVPEGEDARSYIEKYSEKNMEYFKDGESYILDKDGNFSVVKLQSQKEAYSLTVDDDGNVITYVSDGKGNITFKIYRDNELLDTYSISAKGFCRFAANNGVITLCYTGQESSASGDWITIDPNMTDEEYEEFLASLPVPEVNYKMKSVTISYK